MIKAWIVLGVLGIGVNFFIAACGGDIRVEEVETTVETSLTQIEKDRDSCAETKDATVCGRFRRSHRYFKSLCDGAPGADACVEYREYFSIDKKADWQYSEYWFGEDFDDDDGFDGIDDDSVDPDFGVDRDDPRRNGSPGEPLSREAYQ